ncbi:hypothetical protein D3C85_1301470 [compost metagenome]
MLRRNSRTMSSTLRRPTLCSSARSLARWITGPSAIGSENGMPSSITSAPPSTRPCIRLTVRPGLGSPAVMNGIRAFSPAACRRVKVSAIRLITRFLAAGLTISQAGIIGERQRLAAACGQPCPHYRVRPIRPATVLMSLSPRPDRLTRMI